MLCRLGNLSCIPGTHKKMEKETNSTKLSPDLHLHIMAGMPTYAINFSMCPMGCKVDTPPKVSGYKSTVINSSSHTPKQLLNSGCLHPSRTGSSQESAMTSLLPLKLLLLVQGKSLLLVLILQHQEAAQESVVAIMCGTQMKH